MCAANMSADQRVIFHACGVTNRFMLWAVKLELCVFYVIYSCPVTSPFLQ